MNYLHLSDSSSRHKSPSLHRVLQFNKKPNFLWRGEAAPQKIDSLFSCMTLTGVKTKILAGFGAIAISMMILSSALPEALAQSRPTVYKPTAIASGVEVNDILTDKDIPTGQKGFARDYVISAQKDERLEITVNSGSFDTVLSLIDSKGEVISENDDAVGDTTNSLIFFKVRQSGNYIVRVSSFGGSSGGKFTLKVTKLRPTN